MIAQAERTVRRVVHDAEKLKEWVREHIRLRQRPELDERVRAIDVKRLLNRKVIQSLKKGFGASFGRRIGSVRRLGRSIVRLFGF